MAVLPGHEVHGQFVGLGLLSAAAPFEPELGEVFVDLDARLELADLQWASVAGGIADAADEDLWMGQIALSATAAPSVDRGFPARFSARCPSNR